eukprot:Colp12_sorted_trinity150504_noHs@14927
MQQITQPLCLIMGAEEQTYESKGDEAGILVADYNSHGEEVQLCSAPSTEVLSDDSVVAILHSSPSSYTSDVTTSSNSTPPRSPLATSAEAASTEVDSNATTPDSENECGDQVMSDLAEQLHDTLGGPTPTESTNDDVTETTFICPTGSKGSEASTVDGTHENSDAATEMQADEAPSVHDAGVDTTRPLVSGTDMVADGHLDDTGMVADGHHRGTDIVADG